jgi:hypothetical protein
MLPVYAISGAALATAIYALKKCHDCRQKPRFISLRKSTEEKPGSHEERERL